MRLQRQRQREQEGRWSERIEVGLIDDGVDAYTVRSLSHSVDPSAWSYTVRGPSCQLALNVKNLMLHHSSTCQWHTIPVSARSGSPPQCSTFSSYTLTYKIMNHAYQEYLVPAFWSLFLYHKMCLAIDFVYRSLMKEHPWADHLTSLPKKGVGALWVFLHLTIKERPRHVYRDSMPSKQIIVMYNGTTSGFEVLIAHNTLNSNMSPWAWCSRCTHHIIYICLRKNAS